MAWRTMARRSWDQGMDGLLGVAGMIMKQVMKWIIPENSLCLAPVNSSWFYGVLCFHIWMRSFIYMLVALLEYA